MKRIKETPGAHHWPRHKVDTLKLRRRDLVLRISNWLSDKDEPAYDVEVYIGGVYDWNESKTFALSSGLTGGTAKQRAIKHAQKKIRELL